MSNFKCVRSYKSSNGKNYYYGNTINSAVYNTLPYSERINFQYHEDGHSSSSNNSSSSMPDYGSSMDSSSSDSSSSSDKSSFDFGGGDGGGGGATGDW